MALETASNRDDVRKIEEEQSDTVSKVTDRSKFKEEKSGRNGSPPL